MNKFNEGPGAGYTVKVNKFYGDFDTDIIRIYTKGSDILADIRQSSTKFEFDAEWNGYDWSGEEKDIKGFKFLFEGTINLFTDYGSKEAMELFITYLEDIDRYDDFIQFCTKRNLDPIGIDEIINDYLDVNKDIVSRSDFKEFIEYNTRNLDLSLVQITDYEQMVGGGYSHSDMSYLQADSRDLNKQADYEYAVYEGISFYLESNELNDLVNNSYDTKDDYDEYDESIELAEGQELVDNNGNKYLSEKGDKIK